MTAEVTRLKLAEMFTLQVVTVLLILCQMARPAMLAPAMDEERGKQALSPWSVAQLGAALMGHVLQGAQAS